MDTINNIALSLLEHQNEIYVVEWYIAADFVRQFNVTTYKKHIEHSYKALKDENLPRYHLLGIAGAIEEAHALIKAAEDSLGFAPYQGG